MARDQGTNLGILTGEHGPIALLASQCSSDSTSRSDWVHDKFDDDEDSRRPSRSARLPRNDTRQLEEDSTPVGSKIRIDNLHYDLTEEDLEGLFERIGPVQALNMRYDRAGRSEGTAYVTYTSLSDAKHAMREFDGANANGQPIRLTLMPPSASMASSSSSSSRPRNPFDTAQKPGRSLFDRISAPARSPDRHRSSDVSRPAPDHIDRYVPRRDSRSPLPRRRGGGGGGDGRRPGARRDDTGRGGDGRRGATRDGRPKKTQEELDAEMEDYWGGNAEGEKSANANASGGNGNLDATATSTNGAETQSPAVGAPANDDNDDVDMIE
ncbi:MAG: hypothetical protein M1837_005070 [Sclerophora amabilis]|nr:MAG: hypothetical protein M1837_005070 [Sclerophora amabilis]